ncbi:MAG: glycoside hydrolase family 15 protein [Candidatus Krumholzibacteriia bacterium]
MERIPGYHAIDEYGIIGDLHTAALVGPDGGIDWCCLPYFDSPSCFARILDAGIGGCFRVSPVVETQTSVSYVGKTNVLRTVFHAGSCEVVLTDFMPVLSADGSKPDPRRVRICRQIECTRGSGVEIEILFDPRPDYARRDARLAFGTASVRCEDPPLTLRSSRAVAWREGQRTGRLTLDAGDGADLVLTHGNDAGACPPVAEQLEVTKAYWERWIGKCLYRGRWRDAVERSALVLKLMTFRPTGAIIAAPTTSLPESLGDGRNWDYRFSWIRDSALTLNALFLLGYGEEARAYIRWIVDRCRACGENVPILYSITDRDTTPERTLDQLEGYMRSRPVRIGNGARLQVQLDVYGEIIDAIFMYGAWGDPIDDTVYDYVRQMADAICRHWMVKDEGIWEVRGGRQHFTYSKVMCWVGLDRAIRIATERRDTTEREWWEGTRQEIREFIETRCVDAATGAYKQSMESPGPDASSLLIPLFSFQTAQDGTVQRTIDRILELLTENGFVYRYDTDDGLPGEEGAFNICTFWLVEALALAGRTQEALQYFERMREVSGRLGLYAEQTDAKSLQALGNFPQAFTHIGLINAALTLNSLMSREQRDIVQS